MAKRLSVEDFDPRNEYLNEETMNRVSEMITLVMDQLQNDTKQYHKERSPQAAVNVELSKEYLSYLNDWMDQATQYQQQQQPPPPEHVTPCPIIPAILESRYTTHPNPRRCGFRKCIIDQHTGRFSFALVKKIRDTIYGSVRMAVSITQDPNNPEHFTFGNDCVAIKVYSKDKINRKENKDGVHVQEDPYLELAIQHFLGNPGHPYVLPLVACLEDSERLFAVFPHLSGGELFDYVSDHAPLPEHTVRFLMYKALDATMYMHTRGVSHRDISLENFLLGGDHNDQPVMIDFGLACELKRDPDTGGWQRIPHTGALGKFYYMAPEVFAGRTSPPYDGTKADVWSLGVCLFIMLFGVPPWNQPISDDRFREIVNRRNLRGLLQQWNMAASDPAVDLLEKIFQLNPDHRPDVQQIASHPFFASLHG